MACRCGASATGCSCVVIEADTPTVDQHVTGTGEAATPYVVSADVKRSGAAGNTLVINPDGLYVPPPGPAVLPAPGCGLELVGGTYQANVVPFATLDRRTCTDTADGGAAVVPLDPACEAAGMPVYCSSTGDLRTKPEKFTETALATINEAVNVNRASLPFTSSPIQIGADNPSDCYCMCGYLTLAFIPAISAAPGAVISLMHEYDLGDGLGFRPLTGFVFDTRGKTATSSAIQRPAAPLQVCLDPGETKVIRYQVVIDTFTGDNGAAAVLMTGLAREIRFVGSNL